MFVFRCGALHIGDLIRAVDDTSFEHVTVPEAMQILKFTTGSHVSLEIVPMHHVSRQSKQQQHVFPEVNVNKTTAKDFNGRTKNAYQDDNYVSFPPPPPPPPPHPPSTHEHVTRTPSSTPPSIKAHAQSPSLHRKLQNASLSRVSSDARNSAHLSSTSSSSSSPVPQQVSVPGCKFAKSQDAPQVMTSFKQSLENVLSAGRTAGASTPNTPKTKHVPRMTSFDIPDTDKQSPQISRRPQSAENTRQPQQQHQNRNNNHAATTAPSVEPNRKHLQKEANGDSRSSQTSLQSFGCVCDIT